MSRVIKIYTDGGCHNAVGGGKGGYGVVLIYGKHRKELSQGYLKTTSNRMELMAIIKGLEALKKKGLRVEVWSDSRYCVDAISKGWLLKWLRKGKTDRPNMDLWGRLYGLITQHTVTFHWVRGHNGDPDNERCDYLATQAMNGKLIKDSGFLMKKDQISI